MTQEQKKHVLLNVITKGLLYSPTIEWDEFCEPYIAHQERNKSDYVFSSLKELAAALREIADDIDK